MNIPFPRRPLLVGLAIAASLSLGACGSDDNDGGGTAVPGTTTNSGTTTTPGTTTPGTTAPDTTTPGTTTPDTTTPGTTVPGTTAPGTTDPGTTTGPGTTVNPGTTTDPGTIIGPGTVTTPGTTTPDSTGSPSPSDDGAGQADAGDAYDVPMSSREEVPSVDVPSASGTASLSVDAGGMASGTMTLEGLTGPATMAHIHRGSTGRNGPIIVPLQAGSDESTFVVPPDTLLTAEQVEALGSGNLYFNAHTEAHPNGEIRGQIVPRGATFRRGELSGDQEVPATGSEATAAGTALLDEDGMLTAAIVTSGLDDATMAHIHTGEAGENGDVLIGLEQDPADPSLWRTPEGANLDGTARAAFDAEGLYFNVHTPAYPDGEVRGQLCPAVPGAVTGDCAPAESRSGD